MACLMEVMLICWLTVVGPALGKLDSPAKSPNQAGSKSGQAGKEGPNPTGRTPSSIGPLFRLTDRGWSPCWRRNATSCGQTLQDLRCVYTADGRPVPMHFCAGLTETGRTAFRPCRTCPEDCGTTLWSAWSECSSTCSSAARYRTRRVLSPARNGGRDCGPLSETERCRELEDCQTEVLVPVYTWKIGEWTSCRKVSEDATGDCGLGQRFRTISCVDSRGEVSERCIDHHDPQKFYTQPASVQACSIPCNCQTSEWAAWGDCSQTCQNRPGLAQSGPVQSRTREVVRLPENGGLPCPTLIEHRECEGEALPDCPRFEWLVEEWYPCRLAHDNDESCGAGRQKRQVYCSQEGDAKRVPVSRDKCIDSPVNATSLEPPRKRACWLDCPVNCQLGQWQNWSPCSQSCQEGIQVRTREVLVAPAFGGRECGPLSEAKECEYVDCAWWHTSRWSSCILNRGLQMSCGTGFHVRTVYCMSALDELAEGACEGARPAGRGPCSIPCPNDCVISDWSDWGDCSRTCGKKGGTQTRTRQVLAFSDMELDACLPEEELRQTRPCNLHVSCQSYTWQVEAWGPCDSPANASQGEACGLGAGQQARTVSCERESGIASDESLCDPTSKPPARRPCDLPCPLDCRLSSRSALSSCSVTCGGGGVRAQMQVVLQRTAHGGLACPADADEDGLIIRFKPCDDQPPCYSFRWDTGEWTQCEVVGTDCGKGLQTRQVQCQRNDGTTFEPGVCLRELLSSPPPSHQPCLVPCAGDCLLSDWSAFGPCVHDCGVSGHGGYCRMRSRSIISIDPATDNAEELCPHVTDLDLRDYLPCDDNSFSYQWQYGDWQSCILEEGRECGAGSRSRSLICQRSDAVFVPDHFCELLVVKPARDTPCDVPCPRDCLVSDWMPWSPCSQACGQGFQTRIRDIQQESLNGGRGCPPPSDSMICTQLPCEQLEWQVSQWGPCISFDLRSKCGGGAQTRSVSCKAGDSLESECLKRFPKPESSRNCVLPCPGDCVMTDWSDHSPCPMPCRQNSSKSQIRSVIRPPTVTGEQCGALTQTVLCTPADCLQGTGYRLVTGEWSHCKPVSGECGPGMSHRTVNCINADGFTVALTHCPPENVTATQSCQVPCPVRCEPGPYSAWSPCNANCGLVGVSRRSRVVEGYSGGKCAERYALSQTMPCNSVPCYSYAWERGSWSECRFEAERGCGYGERTRFVECRRSDGLTADHQHCIIQDNPDAKDSDILNRILSGTNETELDIETSQRCEKPCPGDCLVSDWSPVSPCYSSCSSDEEPAYSTRSRAVTRPAMSGGVGCPKLLIDPRICPASEAVCPNFTWLVGPFDAISRTRDVWCQLEEGNTGLNMTSGCNFDLQPSSAQDCYPQCTAAGSVCDQGTCRCDDSFEGDGQLCFPTSGCLTDAHCPLPHTFCRPGGQCGCKGGFVPDGPTGLCVESNQLPDERATSPRPDGGDNDVSQYQSKSAVWKWVLVVSVLVVAMVVVVVVIVLVRRQRSREIEFNPIPTLSDSDFQLSKMVKDVVTKC